jgi:hypothetical protein
MNYLRSFCLIIDNAFYCLSHVLREVRFDFIFFFSPAGITEQLSEAEGGQFNRFLQAGYHELPLKN